jgi:hypothetical protein
MAPVEHGAVSTALTKSSSGVARRRRVPSIIHRMHRREEMLAHRVGRAGALTLAVVLIGAIVVAVRVSGADSFASVACHVTHPNGSTAPGERPSDTVHGQRGLWTVLPRDGMLVITTTRPPPPGTTFGKIYPDGSLSTKFPWWGSRSAAAKLRIRGRRLDEHARRLRLTVGRGAIARSPHFWATWPRFASPGCWRVTGRSGRARLTFTITVRSEAR